MLDISVKRSGQRGGWYLCLTFCSQPWNSTSNIIVFSACKEVWAYSQQENQISEFYIFQWRVGFRFSFLEHVFSPLGSPVSPPLLPILSSHIKGPPPPSWQTVSALKRTPSECPLLSSLFILFKEIMAIIISFFLLFLLLLQVKSQWGSHCHIYSFFPAHEMKCVRAHVRLLAALWPGSYVHGILQARILEWVAMPSSRGSSWPRDQTLISCISCIAGVFFTAEPQR